MPAIAHQPHPVTRALGGAHDRLHAVAETPVWSMDPAETTAAIHEHDALAARVAELQARVLRHADRTEVAAATGATSTANWYAHATRTARIMICPCHHARAHDTRYQMTRQPNGKIAFHRRT